MFFNKILYQLGHVSRSSTKPCFLSDREILFRATIHFPFPVKMKKILVVMNVQGDSNYDTFRIIIM